MAVLARDMSLTGFALVKLCKVDRVLGYGSLEKPVSNPVPVPSML